MTDVIIYWGLEITVMQIILVYSTQNYEHSVELNLGTRSSLSIKMNPPAERMKASRDKFTGQQQAS